MTSRRLWVPVLAALLVAALVGPSAVTAAEPRVTVANIMVPAAEFIPAYDNSDYHNGGSTLTAYVDSDFVAPLSFPMPVVNIRRITLYAFDNDGAKQVCVLLYRAKPAEPSEDLAGGVCTSDASAPQAPYTTAIDPRRVNSALQGGFLYVSIGSGLDLYGVKVTYSYETGA